MSCIVAIIISDTSLLVSIPFLPLSSSPHLHTVGWEKKKGNKTEKEEKENICLRKNEKYTMTGKKWKLGINWEKNIWLIK